jgi:hypothetical protein
MANARLDARQQDGAYRRVELITGRRRRRPVDGGEGPNRRGELRRGREHIREGGVPRARRVVPISELVFGILTQHRSSRARARARGWVAESLR